MQESDLQSFMQTQQQSKLFLLRANYGWAAAANRVIKDEMLSRVGRQAGLESSHIGLEVHHNTLCDLEYSDFQNLSANVEVAQPPPYIVAARMEC